MIVTCPEDAATAAAAGTWAAARDEVPTPVAAAAEAGTWAAATAAVTGAWAAATEPGTGTAAATDAMLGAGPAPATEGGIGAGSWAATGTCSAGAGMAARATAAADTATEDSSGVGAAPGGGAESVGAIAGEGSAGTGAARVSFGGAASECGSDAAAVLAPTDGVPVPSVAAVLSAAAAVSEVGAADGAARPGRKVAGSTYPCASAATRTPKWTYGVSCSGVPLGPTVPTCCPSSTVSPLETIVSPRCVSVTE